MVYFHTKKIPFWVHFGAPCSGKFWYILWSFGILYGHLGKFMVTWHIFSRSGVFYKEKSGNPGGEKMQKIVSVLVEFQFFPGKFKSWEKCHLCPVQGCQMVFFQAKNPNLGPFWRALKWKWLVYFMAICNI
jgi:hypothetical protein